MYRRRSVGPDHQLRGERCRGRRWVAPWRRSEVPLWQVLASGTCRHATTSECTWRFVPARRRRRRLHDCDSGHCRLRFRRLRPYRFRVSRRGTPSLAATRGRTRPPGCPTTTTSPTGNACATRLPRAAVWGRVCRTTTTVSIAWSGRTCRSVTAARSAATREVNGRGSKVVDVNGSDPAVGATQPPPPEFQALP